MGLEATLMIVDNSEYMRNGDYLPSRFEAQSDAVTTIFRTKVDSNPESSVGLMTMAGKGPEVLVTHSRDIGQVLGGVHKISGKLGGTADITTALNIAQLVLKHRQNKNLRQRIILFVGSPLEGAAADEKGMVRLAKKLKKNNVAVDVVAFGDVIEEGPEGNVLKAFVDAASSADNSHLVSIPPGPRLLSDIIISSPILAGDRGIPELAAEGGAGGEAAGGSNQFEFGIDPSLDPELAMALRMSMEEEQARQAAAAQTTQEPSGTSAAAPPATTTVPAEPVDDEEEAMLRQALALSEQQDVEMQENAAEDEEMSEEDAIARAIEMSMHQQGEEEQKK